MNAMQKPLYLGARYNEFSAVMFDVIGGQALQHFRAKTPIVNHINLDVSNGTAAVGEKVLAPLPIDMGEAKTLARGAPSVPTDISQAVAEVTINQHRYVEFSITDREFSTSMTNGTPMRAITGAMDSLAKAFNKDILGLSSQVIHTSGGTGPNYTRKAIIKAGSLLDSFDVPDEDRFLGMGINMAEQILDANVSGFDKNDEWFKKGKVLDFLGFGVFKDRLIRGELETDPEPNIAFHRSALTAAVRELESPEGFSTGGVNVQNIVDPKSGISFRMSSWYDGSRSAISVKLELLYGVALTRPNAICIVGGLA